MALRRALAVLAVAAMLALAGCAGRGQESKEDSGSVVP